MPELGTSLSQARIARGLTLDDCERDTRISKRYLDALEREDWKIFPAPVYSRAFLRTYAQYLGLDAQQLMRSMRATEEPSEIKPLPEIRQPAETGSINWPLAGAVVVMLLIAGAFVYFSSRGGDGLAEEEPSAAAESVVPEAFGGGEAPAGRPVGDVQKGIVPDLSGVRVEEAMTALDTAEIDYLVVETEAGQGTPGVVLSQQPAPGTNAGSDTAVTLLVPRGGG